VDPRESVDLTRHRDLGDLLSTTFSLFFRHASVFLTAALIISAPVTLIVDGIWGRALADAADASPPPAVQWTSAGLSVIVIPLVTALQVAIVQGLGRGEQPSVGGALRAASGRIPAAVGAVLLYALAVGLGFLALVIPGIWLLVRWAFAAQAAVVDGLSPVAALGRSAELVKGRWWRTFGMLLASGLLFALIGSLITAILTSIENGAIYVAGLIVVEAWVLSLTGIFGTLLFFDLRARRELPWQGAGTIDTETPERPA
jgi:hypothetical protein